jgi:hypothetical protein
MIALPNRDGTRSPRRRKDSLHTAQDRMCVRQQLRKTRTETKLLPSTESSLGSLPTNSGCATNSNKQETEEKICISSRPERIRALIGPDRNANNGPFCALHFDIRVARSGQNQAAGQTDGRMNVDKKMPPPLFCGWLSANCFSGPENEASKRVTSCTTYKPSILSSGMSSRTRLRPRKRW